MVMQMPLGLSQQLMLAAKAAQALADPMSLAQKAAMTGQAPPPLPPPAAVPAAPVPIASPTAQVPGLTGPDPAASLLTAPAIPSADQLLGAPPQIAGAPVNMAPATTPPAGPIDWQSIGDAASQAASGFGAVRPPTTQPITRLPANFGNLGNRFQPNIEQLLAAYMLGGNQSAAKTPSLGALIRGGA